ncbi:unnamed protein product, partial [Didymodactylos carnosus]
NLTNGCNRFIRYFPVTCDYEQNLDRLSLYTQPFCYYWHSTALYNLISPFSDSSGTIVYDQVKFLAIHNESKENVGGVLLLQDCISFDQLQLILEQSSNLNALTLPLKYLTVLLHNVPSPLHILLQQKVKLLKIEDEWSIENEEDYLLIE